MTKLKLKQQSNEESKYSDRNIRYLMRTNKKNIAELQRYKNNIIILRKVIGDLNKYAVECYNYNKYLYDFIINNKSEITPEHFNGITNCLNSLGSYSTSSNDKNTNDTNTNDTNTNDTNTNQTDTNTNEIV